MTSEPGFHDWKTVVVAFKERQEMKMKGSMVVVAIDRVTVPCIVASRQSQATRQSFGRYRLDGRVGWSFPSRQRCRSQRPR